MKSGEMQTFVDSIKSAAVFLSAEGLYIWNSDWMRE